MKDKRKVPCKDCITLPFCIGRFQKKVKRKLDGGSNLKIARVFALLELDFFCPPIMTFLYEEDGGNILIPGRFEELVKLYYPTVGPDEKSSV